jgi:hypothetical protein
VIYRATGLLLYVFAALTVAFGFSAWQYALKWGFNPLAAWPLFPILALITGMAIWGGRSLRR